MFRTGILSLSLLVAIPFLSVAAPAPALPKVPKELLEKRLDAVRKVFEQKNRQVKLSRAHPSVLFGWSERWLEAELALAGNQADRVKALKDHLHRAQEIERLAINFAKVGGGRHDDAAAATYFRLKAEIRLVMEGVRR
jgi:hypothetical protein